MPSVKEELEALRKQSLAKTQASKLKDKGGALSTPEQEEAQIKDLNDKNRVANYTKDAKQSLKAGTKAVDQDLEFKRQLAAKKKEDKVKQTEAKQSLAAGTKAVDKNSEFQQQSSAQKKADKEQQKQATENLQSFNTSKPKAAASPTKTPAISEAVETVKVEDADDVPDLEEMDDIPTLEEAGDLAGNAGDILYPEMAAPGGVRVKNRSEKKAHKLMERLNMRPVPGITRVTLKNAGNQGFFTIHQPDVYEKNGSYIVFGVARQGTGMPQQQQQQQQQEAAQQLTAIETVAAAEGAAGEPEIVEELVDESGIDPKDIELVIQQAGCSRPKALAALKESGGDLVNAIMSLTK